jgi:hypothetical protein
VTCKACSNRNCDKHKPAKCQVCGGYLSTQHIHLDYVGHAEITDRLLTADPTWNWEPLAWTEDGFPKFSKGASGEMELWIRLTVGGVTRLGVGSVAGNAFDAEKQLIGDALRNASMRFGVALNLWAKEDLESQIPSDEDTKTKRPKPPPAEVDATTGEVVTKRRPPPVGAMKPLTAPAMAKVTDTPAPWDVATDPTPLATPDQVDDITAVIAELKAAGGAWADIGRARWRAAGLPSVGAAVLSVDEAALAYKILDEVRAEIMPTLDEAEGG